MRHQPGLAKPGRGVMWRLVALDFEARIAQVAQGFARGLELKGKGSTLKRVYGP